MLHCKCRISLISLTYLICYYVIAEGVVGVENGVISSVLKVIVMWKEVCGIKGTRLKDFYYFIPF